MWNTTSLQILISGAAGPEVTEDAGDSRTGDLYSEGRSGDLHGAASGYGSYCPEGIPVEFALLSLLAAFGAAFGILYTALTLQTMGRRKRRLAEEEDGDTCLETDRTEEFLSCRLGDFVMEVKERVPVKLWHGN